MGCQQRNKDGREDDVKAPHLLDAMAAAGITLSRDADGTLLCPNQPATGG